jgi:hypothetical protein
MENNNNFQKSSASIIEEIEQQLEVILKKKKDDIEKDLEERINKEKEEAEIRKEQIDKEIAVEREALISHQSILSEIEDEKEKIKEKIKEHLDKAVSFQSEIEEKTGLTLEELNKVAELNKKIDEINDKAGERIGELKKDLEGKYGIVPQLPELTGDDDASLEINYELKKLQKIKELLAESQGDEKEEKEDIEKKEEDKLEPEIIQFESEQVDEKTEKTEEIEKSEETEKPEEQVDAGNQEISSIEESELHKVLSKYRKSEGDGEAGEVSYFENEGNESLDGEYIMASIKNRIDEAKKLYIKIAQNESPKEQFFIKQEIIQHQEIIRKLMLSTIRMYEKNNDFLPEFTKDIINIDTVKTILEEVSMKNWSNQDDFNSFDEFAKELMDKYYERITPPDEYLEAIIQELKIAVE